MGGCATWTSWLKMWSGPFEIRSGSGGLFGQCDQTRCCRMCRVRLRALCVPLNAVRHSRPGLAGFRAAGCASGGSRAPNSILHAFVRFYMHVHDSRERHMEKTDTALLLLRNSDLGQHMCHVARSESELTRSTLDVKSVQPHD